MIALGLSRAITENAALRPVQSFSACSGVSAATTPEGAIVLKNRLDPLHLTVQASPDRHLLQ